MTDAPDDLDVLRRKLSWKGPPTADSRFLNVYMDQNTRCNLKCRMCGFSDARVDALPKYDMPRALFERIAAELFPRASYVCLSIMTEPFMTRDFPERLALVREHGVPFSDIITNGTLLTERAIAKILEAGITRLTFSIDGGTKDVFERVRTGARFETVMRNLHLFLAMRGTALPQLRINHVLSELNIDHFDDFLRLVEEIGAEQIFVRTVSKMSEAEIQESDDLELWDKMRVARRKLAAFCARTGIEDAGYLRDRPTPIDLFDERGAKMICRTPWDTFAIHANGDVHPCMAWLRPPIGNLAQESFEEIWKGSALRALRHEFETVQPGLDCLNCVIRKETPDAYDDFFYRKLAKPLSASSASSR